MVAAMAGFAVEDMFLKLASATLPTGQLMMMFGAVGLAIFACLAIFARQPIFLRSAMERTMLVRMAFEIAGRLFFTLALVLAPLSSATAILQATPIVVVAGAALFFGEHVGWRRWSAIAVGLFGVLLILRPGAESFTPMSVLAVLGMLGFAGRDLATRAASADLGTYVLGVYGYAAIIIAGAGFALFSGESPVVPDQAAAFGVLGAAVFGVAAYSSLTRAMRTGEVSAVTPFRYSRLLFGIGLGVLVFGERPDFWMLLGSAIVVSSGLFILIRGRRKAG